MEKHSENTTSEAKEDPSDISSSGITKNGRSTAWGIPLGSRAFHASTDASLFSSSLPVLPHEKLNFDDAEDLVQSLDDNLPLPGELHRESEEDQDQILEAEMNAIGSMLPDDEDELFADLVDDFDLTRLPSQLEDLDDNDLFGSGGGLEMDYDPRESLSVAFSRVSLSDGVALNGIGQHALPNGVAPIVGEHPYGEHPSRTLFVRNINSNVEDLELRSLFEQYGDIRTLYTACKHRGFVMISYYDIRAARTAMRALQNKPLRRRKLDIHFSIPKDNPSEKDINQGTLVVFNLDPSVSNDDLRQIFGAYGEIKEIRETPHKRHHKFVEFYDVRAADAALKALNRSDIAGKRIKLEPSRPGGARRNLMHQLGHELDHDELRSFRHHVGSPVANSPPGNWTRFGIPVELSSFRSFSNTTGGFGAASPTNGNVLPGLASILPHQMSNATRISPIGKDQGRINHGNQLFPKSLPTQGTSFHHSSSLPDQKLNSSSRFLSGFGEPSSSSIGTLTGPQFLWGSPTPYSERSSSSAWSTSSGGNPFTSMSNNQSFPYPGRCSSFLGSQSYHHVGSAPSGVALDRHFNYLPDSPDTSYTRSIAFGGLSHDDRNLLLNLESAHAAMGAGVAHPGNIGDNSLANFSMMSVPRHGSLFLGNGLYSGLGGTINDGLIERGQNRRPELNMNQIDIKKQYQLDLDKILKREDNRTTLMIKNIPNKYTSKMLLASIDENHRGTYDFLYLPIDFKNKCNVGYAFINMVSPSHIVSFYEAFNGKRWEKFNSEKVASLAYARIQGKAALVAHFQNSSLMNEDKRCRPILFHSEGEENIDEEPLLSSNLNICIRQPDGSYSGDLLDSPKGMIIPMRS